MTASEGDLTTEVEQLRAERDRLRYELAHRVKNTLSMAQALANQTFRDHASPTHALASFNDRIVAMARANDVLREQSWTTASLRSVAESLEKAPSSARGPLSLSGPHVEISAGAALSFAMALHELATNARHFGAWSAPAGRVALGWEVTPGEPGQEFHLSWTETGGPPCQPPEKRGFGLRLAEQSLRSAFGRDIAFAFEPSGLDIRVRAPLAAISA